LNYHLVHHDLPGLPWYGLRQVYLAERSAYQQRSQGFVVQGYGQWVNEYAFTPIDVEVHPFCVGELPRETQGENPVWSTETFIVRWTRASQDFPIDLAK
ncbi:MAG: fatty acid desaturase, partial [Serratia grimesii]